MHVIYIYNEKTTKLEKKSKWSQTLYPNFIDLWKMLQPWELLVVEKDLEMLQTITLTDKPQLWPTMHIL